ncbi:MAG: hypothetical protein QNJ00_12620 [Woeseiaceae bacterium]|nr:hypothetical protein [Woeseiaceae bacterium]
MSWSRLFAAGAALLVIAACGFQMRGQPALPAEMASTYIAADDRRSLFYRRLRSELMENGVTVVDTPVEATAVLNILDDRTGQRVLSVSARNLPREFEVFYRVTYSLENDERTLLEPQERTVTRNYTWDETLVLGKAREGELLTEAIADDLVRIVLFQLAAL